jgi:hypothetical protein
MIALLATTAGVVAVALKAPSGEVSLPLTLATQLILIALTSLFGAGTAVYTYWKRCQPSEKAARALQQGRPVCHCTEDGVVMLLDPKQSSSSFWRYECPQCGNRNDGLSPGMATALKRK